MQQYLNLLKHVMENGVEKEDRTGTGTKSVLGNQMRFKLSEGFPLVTTKKVYLRSVIHELLWFLAGDTNIKYLNDNGVHIWDAWADENGDLGPVYGAQWRKWKTASGEQVDQVEKTLNILRDDPDSRRMVISSWNVGELGSMALEPCHCLFQFYVANGTLSCHLYQRSADLFLGVPFNIASYSLLTQMVAFLFELELGDFVISFGDAHIYTNHFEQVEEQLSRAPKPLPIIEIVREPSSIFDFRFEDFEILGYEPHPAIKGEIAV